MQLLNCVSYSGREPTGLGLFPASAVSSEALNIHYEAGVLWRIWRGWSNGVILDELGSANADSVDQRSVVKAGKRGHWQLYCGRSNVMPAIHHYYDYYYHYEQLLPPLIPLPSTLTNGVHGLDLTFLVNLIIATMDLFRGRGHR